MSVTSQTACTMTSSTPPSDTTCHEQYITISGGHQLYTKQYGSATATSPTVLLINGGPGYSHVVLAPVYTALHQQHGMHVVVYDQLGCGKSDRPTDTDGTLWTMQRQVEDVEEVVQALKLQQFIVYGHSHGAMLAIDYAIRYGSHQSPLLQAVIVSNTSLDYPARIAHVKQLTTTWPQEAQDTVQQYLKSGKPADNAAVNAVFAEHFQPVYFSHKPFPPELAEAANDANNDIVQAMFGDAPFYSTGPASGWSAMQHLPHVQTPTLIMTGKHDYTPLANLVESHRLLPHSELFISPHGSHMAYVDDADNYMDALVSYIKRVSKTSR